MVAIQLGSSPIASQVANQSLGIDLTDAYSLVKRKWLTIKIVCFRLSSTYSILTRSDLTTHSFVDLHSFSMHIPVTLFQQTLVLTPTEVENITFFHNNLGCWQFAISLRILVAPLSLWTNVLILIHHFACMTPTETKIQKASKDLVS